MSYVLEALKKREADENPDAAVALSLATQRERRHRRLGILLWAALAINLCALAALLVWPGGLLQWGRDRAAELTADVPEAATAVSNAPSPLIDSPSSPAIADEGNAQRTATPTGPMTSTGAAGLGVPAEPAEPAAPAAAATPAPPAARQPASARTQAEPAPERRREPVSLEDLPASVRERFPGIVFSTHIYADDRDLRAVVANGQRLAEGDRLGAVRVSRITETGVILDFEDYLISVPVVGFWDTP